MCNKKIKLIIIFTFIQRENKLIKHREEEIMLNRHTYILCVEEELIRQQAHIQSYVNFQCVFENTVEFKRLVNVRLGC